mmetsp:Transcript_904/g.1945  ORF Transcript_904/g.1945 Transcript_904/m.1945 type:complete len:936 (+) Transcript_904:203-3010(+)
MLSSSLGKWEELRVSESENILPREGNQVLDVLRNYVDEDDGEAAKDIKDIAFCQVVMVVPLSIDKIDTNGPRFWDAGYEMAVGTALALRHLNEGDGSFVKEVEGLNERCNIRFTPKVVDTYQNAGITMSQIVRLTDESNSRHPCAFVGAFRSAVSGPSSIITSLQGYPQISGGSTSAQLDDKSQYPKFARTIPSDDGVAVAIIEHISTSLGLEHLAVININDAFGNSFVNGLKDAAAKTAPNMTIVQIPIDETQESIEQAIASLKQTKYRFVFCIAFSHLHNPIMIEASRMGVAGDGEHNWMFADPFAGVLSNIEFEKGSVLHKAYRGTGMLVSSAKAGPQFSPFSESMRALKNKDDFEYLNSIVPHFNETPYFDISGAFMDPIVYDYTMFVYDATILLGLAACGATTENLTMTGDTFYDRIVNFEAFEGVSGSVDLDPTTGTREPLSAFYTLSNYVEEERFDEETGKTMVKFQSVTTDMYSNGTWSSLLDYTFNDGTYNPPKGIPSPDTKENFIQPWIHVLVLTLCVSAMLLSTGLALWTWHFRRTRVVAASQPVFLLLICLGCFIMASAIIPLQFDHNVADIQGCTIACNAVAWQAFIGFGIIFSSIVCKTHRINLVMQNAARFTRIKVTVQETIKPGLALTCLNIILLSVMTAFQPMMYEIEILTRDEFDQAVETYSYCSWSKSIYYILPLVVLNMTSVIIAIVEAWKARQIATEFSESQYIFKALVTIMLVIFIGGPILFIARDNPNALAFVLSGIIFVGVCSILLLMFVPKILFHRESQRMKKRKKSRYSFSMSGSIQESMMFESEKLYHDETCSHYSGEKILTTKTQKELSEQVSILKKLLEQARKKNTTRCRHCAAEFYALKGSESYFTQEEVIDDHNMKISDLGKSENYSQGVDNTDKAASVSRTAMDSNYDSVLSIHDGSGSDEES